MKKILQFFMIVVVALISGFPQQVTGQNKTCYKLKPKFFYPDSLNQKVDTVILINALMKFEELFNSSGTNKGIDIEYAGILRVPSSVPYNWNSLKNQSQLLSYFQSWLNTNEKDTSILPIFLDNAKKFTLYYPSGEYKRSFCITGGLSSNFFIDDAILWARPDSLSYNSDFMVTILTRAVLQKMGIGNEPDTSGHIMVASGKAWNALPIFSNATKVALRNLSLPCMPTVPLCTPSSVEGGKVSYTKDFITIIGNKIYNKNKSKISVHDLMGRKVLSSNDEIIDIAYIIPSGIYIIQSDYHKPFKVYR